jgi:predicted O-methyltransferase YrrM
VINKTIEEIYRTGKVKDGAGKTLSPFPTSISYDDGLAIYNLLRRKNPQRTLEIGMAYGLSTQFICQALADNHNGMHTAIDPRQTCDWGSIGIKNLKDSGLEKICRFYEEDSCAALPKLAGGEERFDFIFIDGIHHFDHALVDFFYSDRLLAEGGCIMLHDVWMDAIGKLLRFILVNRDYRVIPEKEWNALSCGQRASRTLRRLKLNPLRGWLPNYRLIQKSGNGARKWDYFRDF